MVVGRAGVVGAGARGAGIAQLIAAAGVPVVLKDVEPERLEAGLREARTITERQVAKLVEQGRLSDSQAAGRVQETCALIAGTTSYDGFGDVDLVVEAVPERMDVKHEVLAALDAATPGHAILASSTSGLSITELGDATSRPDKVLGLHFLRPPSRTRLVEVVEGEETAAEATQAAVAFAQAVRKVPIRVQDCPGFVVNRILLSAASEAWRHQEESGVAPEALDALLAERAGLAPGPFGIADVAGPKAIVRLARDLRDAYGHRFWVHRDMARRAGRGAAGATEGSASGSAGRAGGPAERVADRFELKALVEACLVVEEGVAGIRDVDLGMALGTGMAAGPFARADARGLDDVLAALERAEREWGEGFEPPLVLRRLVAQGRLGARTGQGFHPYPRPDAGYESAPVKLETRGDVAVLWLDNPPANSLSPVVVEALERAWDAIEASSAVRATVLASPNPALFCAGADIKAFAGMDPDAARALLDRMHALLRRWERSGILTIAAVNGAALGGGCEVAMACDVRLAAYSAAFGQPEISLGIIPGFGGTQRLPRLVGPAKALEMNLTGEAISAGDAYDVGLVNRLVPDHELFDAALAWARRAAAQAPLAREQVKRVSHAAVLDEGLEAEKAAFRDVFATGDAREGIGAFLAKRRPRFTGG